MSTRLAHASTISADLLRQAHEWMDQTQAAALVVDPTTEATPMWTLADLRRAARIAVARCSITPALAREPDLLGVAQSAIGLAIAADPHITFRDAVVAGCRDVWDAASRARRDQGYNPDGTPMHAHAVYWADALGRMPSPTGCEEYLALANVMAALPDKHRSTLLALAAAGTTHDAADALGVNYPAMVVRVRRAREAAFALWFDTETPPKPRRHSHHKNTTHCPRGHELTGTNRGRHWSNQRHTTYIICLACKREARLEREERDA